ncbi:MAG TPA: histidine--tRNA ligase [Dehalococcoidia bacterium]|nr:histidine--tRNA ligase [Dehalococcoidia bacterium]
MFQSPRGTFDILPADQPYWRHIRDHVEAWCARFGYERIDTPIFEEAALFTHATGQGTDIVEKEMYTFEDRSGDLLALRPEGTPNTLRAYVQHGMASLPQPVRLYYWAPSFRYERPQAGRYRQFWQFGCEAIGEADAAIDAEQIELCVRLYDSLGLRNIQLQLNSIGDATCRPAYIDSLRAYYAPRLDVVCPDCRQRYERNALRLLDCKNPACQPIIAEAPVITHHLCADCSAHFASVRAYLDEIGIAYVIAPRLVRGLDYYTRTVFEFVPEGGGQQSTVGAGGRYDGLMETLGGRPTPGTGFALGIDRLVLNLKEAEAYVPPLPRAEVYVAYQVEEARGAATRVASALRSAGIGTIAGAGRSLKSQLRQADALGMTYTVIIGRQELASGTAQVRRMADGGQYHVDLEDLPKALASLLDTGVEMHASYDQHRVDQDVGAAMTFGTPTQLQQDTGEGYVGPPPRD